MSPHVLISKDEIVPVAARSDSDAAAPEAYQSGSMPEIFQLIEMVGKKLKQLQNQTLRLAHLTPPQFFILTLLWQADGRPFKDLAQALTCTRATITGIVDTLERKGLVSRAPHPSDRRSQLVQLTQAGRELQRSIPDLERMFNGCCAGLEPRESQELSRLLKKLDSSLDFSGE
jgi:DNA-binding MarR family transcriptional regulator